jgi:hypothetical protein
MKEGASMNGAVVIRWGASIPGREAKGLEVFGGAVTRFEGLTKQGRVHAHREYFSLTGRDGGFMLIEGELRELLTIVAEPETLALNAQAAAIVQDFEVQVYAGGNDQAVQELMGTYTTSIKQIGYM